MAPAILSLTVGEEPITGLELVLVEGAAITGAVLGVAPGEGGRVTVTATPLTGVATRSSGRSRSDWGIVDATGNYRISGLDPGTWRLEASLPGTGRRAEATVEVLAGETEVIQDLELAGGDLRLTGVVLAGGEPDAGVSVSTAASPGSSAWSKTGRDGRFRLEGLEPGSYQVLVTGDWGDHRETVELWSDRELEISIALGRVAGRVITAGGEPLDEVAVALSADGRPVARKLSDAEGRFEFLRIREAQYRLSAALEGYATATIDVDVAGAVELEVVLHRDMQE